MTAPNGPAPALTPERLAEIRADAVSAMAICDAMDPNNAPAVIYAAAKCAGSVIRDLLSDRDAIAENLAGAERERDDLAEALWQDESRLLAAHANIQREIRSYSWLLESRGPYEWDDDQYKDEAGRCMRRVIELSNAAYEPSKNRMRVNEKRFDGIGAPYRVALRRAETAESLLSSEREKVARLSRAFRHVPQQIADLGDSEDTPQEPNALLTSCIRVAQNAVENFDYDEKHFAAALVEPAPAAIPEDALILVKEPVDRKTLAILDAPAAGKCGTKDGAK